MCNSVVSILQKFVSTGVCLVLFWSLLHFLKEVFVSSMGNECWKSAEKGDYFDVGRRVEGVEGISLAGGVV